MSVPDGLDVHLNVDNCNTQKECERLFVVGTDATLPCALHTRRCFWAQSGDVLIEEGLYSRAINRIRGREIGIGSTQASP